MSTTKVAIICLFVTLSVASTVADDPVTLNETTTSNNASQQAIHDLCSYSSDHAQTCIDSLSKATNSSNTKTLIVVSFQLVIKEVENVIKQIDDIRKAAKEPILAGPMGLYGGCQRLLQSYIGEIQTAIDLANSIDSTRDLAAVGDGMNMHLSAALSHYGMCLYDFEEDFPDRNAQMIELLKVPIALTAVGLSWSAGLPNLMKSSSPRS